MRIAALKWTKLATATVLFALMISASPAADARAGDCHRLLCRMFVSCVDCDVNCAVTCEWGECVPWTGGGERCKCFICAEE